jgi:hypothetical protein
MSDKSDSLAPELLPPVRIAGPSEADSVAEPLRLNGAPTSWDTATRRFNSLVEHFEAESKPHRLLQDDLFTEEWANAMWSQLYHFDNRACEWAEQTVLLTFTGSYYLDKATGKYVPPMTYFKLLQTSVSARQKAQSRVLSDISSKRSVTVVGLMPSRDSRAYPVVFLGLYLSSPVEIADLAPILTAHTENCPIAEPSAHQPDEAITVEQQPTHKSKLIHGLGKRVPGLKSNQGVTKESWARRALAAVLYAGGWRACRFG